MNRLAEIFENKQNSCNDKNIYYITPDNFKWQADIYEARGHGHPIACYGDTSDKFVLTPQHLGYNTFSYSSKEWGIQGWDSDTNSELIEKGNKEIYEIGLELAKKYKVWLVSVNITYKGYTSNTILELPDFDIKKLIDINADNLVLFVFEDFEKVKNYFKK